LRLFGGFVWTDAPLAFDLQSGQFFALDHASYDSRRYCQQRSGLPDRQQVPRPKIIFLWFHAPKIEQRQCHAILSVAARLLAKAAVLPFSRVGQSLTIPAKAHRRRDPSGEHAVPHDGANWRKRGRSRL
jgi:hypothetical protein